MSFREKEAVADRAARERDFDTLDQLLKQGVIHSDNILDFCVNPAVFIYLFRHIPTKPSSSVLNQALASAVSLKDNALVTQLEHLGGKFASQLHELCYHASIGDKSALKSIKLALKNNSAHELTIKDALGATPWHYALLGEVIGALDAFQRQSPFKREGNHFFDYALKAKHKSAINWLQDHHYFKDDHEFVTMLGGYKNAAFALLDRIKLYADKPWQTKVKKAGGPWRFYRYLDHAVNYFLKAGEEGYAPLAAIVKALEKNLEFASDDREKNLMLKLIAKKPENATLS